MLVGGQDPVQMFQLICLIATVHTSRAQIRTHSQLEIWQSKQRITPQDGQAEGLVGA